MADEFSFDERTLAADLFACHDEVLALLRRALAAVDPNLLDEAFVETVLELSKKPDKFDANRGSLVGFLAGATRRRLRDLQRSIEARRRREQKKGTALVAERTGAAREVWELLADAELADIARKEARTEEEKIVLRLWEQGIDDFGRYAAELGISHLSIREQEAQVKRIRDRVLKRISRLRDRLEGPGR